METWRVEILVQNVESVQRRQKHKQKLQTNQIQAVKKHSLFEFVACRSYRQVSNYQRNDLNCHCVAIEKPRAMAMLSWHFAEETRAIVSRV